MEEQKNELQKYALPQCDCKAVSQELAKRKSFLHIAGQMQLLPLALQAKQVGKS